MIPYEVVAYFNVFSFGMLYRVFLINLLHWYCHKVNEIGKELDQNQLAVV